VRRRPSDGDGQACVFAAGPPQRVRGGVDGLRELIALASPALARQLGAGREPAEVRGGGGRAGFLRRAYGPGWALVGSAGAWTDPIAGHGLTEALRDAELLATALVDVAAGGRPEPMPSPASTPPVTASPDPSSTSSTRSPGCAGPTTRSSASWCGCARP
jgi:hypothetical protein